MRSYLGTFVNRETEQAIIDFICSFHTHPDKEPNHFVRLNVFVRKNRHLGRIYVERTGSNMKLLERRYYSAWNWRLQNETAKHDIIRLLLRAKNICCGIKLPIRIPMEEILFSNQVLEY